MKLKEEWMQKTIVVWLGALLCCLLWGSAFSGIKIGYRLFEINAADTATQLLFAGCRFTLAGILADNYPVLFLLYGTCSYQWGQGFYYRSS